MWYRFPAILRERDVSASFISIIDTLGQKVESDSDIETIQSDVVCAIANFFLFYFYMIIQKQNINFIKRGKELRDHYHDEGGWYNRMNGCKVTQASDYNKLINLVKEMY